MREREGQKELQGEKVRKRDEREREGQNGGSVERKIRRKRSIPRVILKRMDQ
jgi:hypothetical protein